MMDFASERAKVQLLVLQPIVGVRYFQKPRLRVRHRHPIRQIAGLLGFLPP